MNKIAIDGITKIYATSEGNKTALNNVSFQIDEGSVTVIGGENGSGKSVLMNIIAGLEKPTSGKIHSFAKAGLVFQEADTQILGETPREDISFGPKNQKKSKIQVEQAVENSLEQVGLAKKADYPARFLSGGEKRRLAVACMLAMELPVIIFDEPYANLDYGGVKQVNALLKRLHEQKKTVIILTHELEKCLGLADKFVVLFRGDKVFDGTAQEGLLQNLEQWNIRNPLNAYSKVEDLVWL
ncbi:MAG: ABC transporter ATP-binding protein [Treponema berlinense]|uniref:energy-coupling factor ABC transporter ATP-binding protein n=1 Tax=Treponema TaxID=157 RepID=UPI0023F36FAB|nr:MULTISPECIES: ABC transporter ATP-binding protein [Treponema]MBQ9101696.1 ABC transporter ATP-binding protein [Treponema sp.]MDD5834322.1 ABC transporter ATP-binding protein [Treponema berlinense]